MLAGVLTPAHFIGIELGNSAMQLGVMRPHGTVACEHFVIGAAKPVSGVRAFEGGWRRGGLRQDDRGLSRFFRSCETFMLPCANEKQSLSFVKR